jgi:hypothetical protein
MKIVNFCFAVLLVCLLASCESPRTLELSIPLKYSQPVRPDAKADDVTISVIPINPLDVLVAVETVAANNGLKPWVDPLDNDDLLGLADDAPSNTASQTWRHPDHPVYLTATRHKNEILLLLNRPSDADPNPKGQKLFTIVRTQLMQAMEQFLHPAPPPQEKSK